MPDHAEKFLTPTSLGVLAAATRRAQALNPANLPPGTPATFEERRTRRALAVLVTFASLLPASAAAHEQPRPMASLELPNLLSGPAAGIWGTVAFISDELLAVGLCRAPSNAECSLSLIRAEEGALRPFAETRNFSVSEMHLHRFAGRQVLSVPSEAAQVVLYSADLSTTRKFIPLQYASYSGEILAESMPGGWRLDRLDSKLDAIRIGKGSLRSVSDKVVAFQDGVTMRVEAIDGKPLGGFRVRPEMRCYNTAEIAGDDRLYVDDCRTIRMVNFNGGTELTLQRPKGHCDQGFQFDRWSADGKRVVFDCYSAKVPFLRALADTVRNLSSLGMCCEEWDNREEVRVVDTISGNTCFDWRRQLKMGTEPFVRTTTISPSGEFVAILADGALLLYQIQTVCDRPK